MSKWIMHSSGPWKDHKYQKRTGSPGNYVYSYGENESGKNNSNAEKYNSAAKSGYGNKGEKSKYPWRNNDYWDFKNPERSTTIAFNSDNKNQLKDLPDNLKTAFANNAGRKGHENQTVRKTPEVEDWYNREVRTNSNSYAPYIKRYSKLSVSDLRKYMNR